LIPAVEGSTGVLPPSAKLRHHSVSVESLTEASEHLANRIDAAAFDRDQPSLFFAELEFRSGLNSKPNPEPFWNRNLATLTDARFHSSILSGGHMVSR
jgi:hypothetical protein